MIKLSLTQRRLIGAIALLTVLASACSRHETAKTLAGRLSEANRVIVLNRDGAAMTIKGDLLKQLVQAIATAPEIPNGDTLTATPGFTLVFFRSSVHLATVPTGADSIFYIDKAAYADKTGVLRALWERPFEKNSSSH